MNLVFPSASESPPRSMASNPFVENPENGEKRSFSNISIVLRRLPGMGGANISGCKIGTLSIGVGGGAT